LVNGALSVLPPSGAAEVLLDISELVLLAASLAEDPVAVFASVCVDVGETLPPLELDVEDAPSTECVEVVECVVFWPLVPDTVVRRRLVLADSGFEVG
jgi:hypothetical protein